MKKGLAIWVIGGIVTASAIGLSFKATVAGAAQQEVTNMPMHNMMGQDGHHMGTSDMMKNGDMQKKCVEMMKSPEMQSMMKDMMKDVAKEMK